MQPISSFNSNLGTAHLIVGGAGSGKTVLACRLYPKTYVFVADLNFESARRYLTELGILSNIVGFDTATPDEKGSAVPALLRYDRMLRCLNDAIKSPDVDAVAVDSTTFVEDIIKAKICMAQSDTSIRLDGFKQWGDLILMWKSLILQLRASGKKIIFTGHEVKEKDESDGVFKYKISVDGKTAALLPILFSDVWRTEVREPKIPGGKFEWWIRTLSTLRQEHLKNTYGLPGELLQDDLVKRIQSIK